MVVEIREPNTCVRGCCRSGKIPLHLPTSSYSLLSPIAKGSEGTVFEALILHDNGHKQRVAAKKPLLSTSLDLDNFHRQLQLLCKLDHPGLAKFVAAHARPPNYLLFFELYGSSNLAEKIHVEEWNPSIGEVLFIAIGIAESLQYLHKLGIVHRDVKPSNILLDRSLHPRVADFGLATYIEDLKPMTSGTWKSSGKPTGGFHKKNMVGTLIYMAPEILRRETHTEKSDVYSFAVTINELLTGVVPYTDLRAEAQAHTVLEMNYTEQQLTAAVVAEGLRPLLAKSESSTESLLSLIQRCWSPDPLLRPSFDEVTQILKSIAGPAEVHMKVDEKNQKVPVFSSDGSPSQMDHIQSLHEDLNWFTQGERVFSNEAKFTTGTWSIYSQNHVIYRPKFSWGSFATCGRREKMEDTHILLPNFCNETDVHLFGIFDGHRGAAAAEFSARAIPGFLSQLCSTKSPADALIEAFKQTDIAFQKELALQYVSKRIRQKDWHPGCTALTALIIGDTIFVANAGDCRAVLCRSGNPLSLSKDHVASCPSERERVMKGGVEVKWLVDTWRIGSAGLQVTRSIGDDDLKPAVMAEPEITQTLISTEDEYMVMASDGLWDILSNEAVMGIIKDTVKDPGMCSKRLAAEAAERGSKDNITVIVVFLREVSTAERVY